MGMIAHTCRPGIPCNFCRTNVAKGYEPNHPLSDEPRGSAPPSQPARPLCRHLGKDTGGREKCDPCGGNVQLHVMACAVHRKCTIAKPVEHLACCATCKQYEEPLQLGTPSIRLVVPADESFPPPRHKLAVATLAVGKVGDEMLSVTGPLMQQYADRIGADFVAITGEAANRNYPLGDKFRLHRLLDRWERCLFLDVDAVVRKDCPSLFDVVPRGHVGYHDDRPNLPDPRFIYGEIRRAAEVNAARIQPDQILNSGVVVWDRQTPDVWLPPAGFPSMSGSGKPHHVAEQCQVQVNVERNGYPLFKLGEEYNYQWWADRQFRRLAGVRPKILHMAGVSQIQQVGEWKMGPGEWRLALLRLASIGDE